MLGKLPKIAANDEHPYDKNRSRTTPIPASITPIPGYPTKLVIFKYPASQFWQVRYWMDGKIFKKSTKSTSVKVAQQFARGFFDQLLASKFASTTQHLKIRDITDRSVEGIDMRYFAGKLLSNERARVARGDFSRGSFQVLENRLNLVVIPKWGSLHPSKVSATDLNELVNELSLTHSSTTISQYLIAIRKVLSTAIVLGELDKLPLFPKVKIRNRSRGGFTPTEYWKILRSSVHERGSRSNHTSSQLRATYGIRENESVLPDDLAWAIRFMVNSFIRPSDLKFLRHKHVEIVKSQQLYLRLTLPPTKNHDKPIVTLTAAVHVYRALLKKHSQSELASPNDYLFLPQLKDRDYALRTLAFHFNRVLEDLELKHGPNGQSRTLYSLRHSSITFRLLYGQGIDLLTLARNARTSIEMINQHYASTVTPEQNIAMLQSRRLQYEPKT